MVHGELQPSEDVEDSIAPQDASVVAPGTIHGKFVGKRVIGAVDDNHQLVGYNFVFKTLDGSPMPDTFKINLLEIGGVAMPVVQAQEKPAIEG
jgi:hypothetical protein